MNMLCQCVKLIMNEKSRSLIILKMKLKPGTYPYKFIIDVVWTLDPENIKAELDDIENINPILIVK